MQARWPVPVFVGSEASIVSLQTQRQPLFMYYYFAGINTLPLMASTDPAAVLHQPPGCQQRINTHHRKVSPPVPMTFIFTSATLNNRGSLNCTGKHFIPLSGSFSSFIPPHWPPPRQGSGREHRSTFLSKFPFSTALEWGCLVAFAPLCTPPGPASSWLLGEAATECSDGDASVGVAETRITLFIYFFLCVTGSNCSSG